ncbi:MAG: hypothetical protein P8183_05600, partial [Anaerolineae bacterium]
MKSLRTRLLLAYAGLILAGFSVLAVVAGRQILTSTVQDYASGLGEQAQLVARALKEPLEEGGGSQSTLISLLQTYADQVGAEVMLYDRRGHFVASSSDSNNANTTVIEAALGGSTSSDTQSSMAYAAAPILEEGRVLGVIQLVRPLSAAQTLVWDRLLALG